MLEINNKFILRTPLLSFYNLSKEYSNRSSDEVTAKLINDPVFLDVLNFSSKDLFELVNDNTELSSKKQDKIDSTILKYFTRICTRPTNFSILGTYAIGNFGNAYEFEPDPDNKYSFFCSPDMVLLYNFYKKITREEIKLKSKFYINNTSYKTNGKFKYIERRENDSIKFNFIFSTFESSEVIDIMMDHFKSGVSALELHGALNSHGYEIPLDSITSFIEELTENSIIISSLSPVPSSIRYSKILEEFYRGNADYNNLSAVLDKIRSLNKCVLGDFHHKISQISTEVENLGVNLPKRTLVNVETKRNFKKNSLPSQIKNDLLTAFKIMASTQETFVIKELEEFKEAIFKSYENEYVPLNLLLDPEVGIGYPVNSAIKNYKDNFITNLDFSTNQPEVKNTLNSIIKFIPEEGPLRLDGVKEWVSRESNFDKFYSSYYGKFSVISHNEEGTQIYVDEFIGPSATRIISRQSEDIEVSELIDQLAQSDKNFYENHVVAEIVFLPQLRAGNIISHDNAYHYQIPILVPLNFVKNPIELSDLFLTVRNDKINLYSKSLNKFVYPILSNSYNYSLANVPVYNFLCDLQHQYVGIGPVRWKWPMHLKDLDYLPQVRFKNIIVSKAKWTIKNKEANSFKEFEHLIQKEISKSKIPQYVTIHDREASLFLNLKDEKFLKLAYGLFKKTKLIELEEFLFDDATIPSTDGHDAFINEYVCFVSNSSKAKTVRENPMTEDFTRYNLGSEWIYVKIHCPQLKANRLLTSFIRPLVMDESIISQLKGWHYIRFIEQDNFHIRLRLQLDNKESFSVVLSQLLVYLNKIDSSYIDHYSFDSYRPEISRYGGLEFHNLALRFFTIDSRYCLEILNSQTSFGSWIVLKSIDRYLTDFGFTLEEKIRFCENSTLNYREEFELSKNKNFIKSVFKKYKDEKNKILEVFKDEASESLFNKRSSELTILILSLKANDKNLVSVIESFFHIHVIRLLETRQRFQEMVVYDLLSIYYRGQVFKTKNINSLEKTKTTEYDI